MTWCRYWMKLVSVLASTGASRFRVLSPRDENCCCLETVRDVTQYQIIGANVVYHVYGTHSP